MEVQNKIVYVFNRFLIDFFKEIKKDSYFKLAIKKNYKLIAKKSPKYINNFKDKITPFNDILCGENLDIEELCKNEDFKNTCIFKNIKIGKLINVYKDDDIKIVFSYLLILYLFLYLYEESVILIEMLNNEKAENVLSDNGEENSGESENGEENSGESDNGEENSGESDNGEENSGESDNESKEDIEDDESNIDEVQLSKLLLNILTILNDIDLKNNIDSELNDILDDDIKNLLLNIEKCKKSQINIDNNLDELIGDSKIGNLAKEISNSINLDSLNLENPEDLLNPANLFNENTGNILGNLVQQVGTSITDKISSGDINQEDLIKDAFSLMNRMQNTSSNNPVIGDMMKNMMNSHSNNSSDNNDNNDNNDNGNENDFSKMMKNMINPDMMQQMMNSMGGTTALNQNNPNSREGKMRTKLQKKVNDKNK